MKTLLLVSIIIVIGLVFAISGIFYYRDIYTQNCEAEGGSMTGFLSCIKVYRDFDTPITDFDMASKNLTKTILSSASYSDKIYAIKMAVGQSNEEFSKIVLTDLKSDYTDGEKITFGLPTFGYYNWCLFPSLSLYYEKYDKPIWEGSIVTTCPPPSETPHPVIIYWKSSDFYQFPTCRYEGVHTIYGQSYKFGPTVLGQYYCHGKKEFHSPNTIEIIIPNGASNSDLKKNFEPSEINVNWGDYVNIINKDNATHGIIGETERTRGSDGVEFYATLEPNQSFQTKMLENGTNWLYSETPDNKKFEWMRGVINVE